MPKRPSHTYAVDPSTGRPFSPKIRLSVFRRFLRLRRKDSARPQSSAKTVSPVASRGTDADGNPRFYVTLSNGQRIAPGYSLAGDRRAHRHRNPVIVELALEGLQKGSDWVNHLRVLKDEGLIPSPTA